MVKKTEFRAYALDALRGIAILTMVLSGAIPFYKNTLPAWNYHAQVPPPTHSFNPNLPGVTWVDLVFPLFLFAMGTAFPFALSKKIEKGEPYWKILLQIIWRGILLVGFAIYLKHINPYLLSSNPGTTEWLIALFGFLLLFPMLLLLPNNFSKNLKITIKIGSFAIAIFMLSQLTYSNGTGFMVTRNDIIILVLASVAVFGSIIWLITRANILLRLGILGILLGLRLSHSVEGDWTQWLWNISPEWMKGLFLVEYLKYLFIVIPGTIIGDIMLKWMKDMNASNEEMRTNNWKKILLVSILLVAVVISNLALLYSRQMEVNLLVNFILLIIGFYLLNKPANQTEKLYKTLFNWGIYWLVTGLCFEAFEGGIKKDPSTLGYYFVMTGLSIFVLLWCSIIIDYFKKRKYLVSLLIANGQNPMIAYIGKVNFVEPVLALLPTLGLVSIFGYYSINDFIVAISNNWFLGMLKGFLYTYLVALVTYYCTKFKLFWRT